MHLISSSSGNWRASWPSGAHNPRVPGDALSGMRDCYKIKLRSSGVRLAYLVQGGEIVLLVLAVGKWEREEVYRQAHAELARIDD